MGKKKRHRVSVSRLDAKQLFERRRLINRAQVLLKSRLWAIFAQKAFRHLRPERIDLLMRRVREAARNIAPETLIKLDAGNLQAERKKDSSGLESQKQPLPLSLICL